MSTFYAALFVLGLLFAGCSSDEEASNSAVSSSASSLFSPIGGSSTNSSASSTSQVPASSVASDTVSSTLSSQSVSSAVTLIFEPDPKNVSVNLVTLSPVEVDSTEKDGTYIESTEGNVTVVRLSNVKSGVIGDPLFVDGIFKGMITQQIPLAGGLSELTLGPPEDLADVIEEFTVAVDLRDAKISTPANAPSLGGTDPRITYSLFQRPVADGMGREVGTEPVLRIAIPESVTMQAPNAPMQVAYNADATVAISGDTSFEKDFNQTFNIDYTHETQGITLTSNGSHIDIGLGIDLYAYARIVRRQENRRLIVILERSALFVSDLHFDVHGELADAWESDIELAEISIPVPLSAGITLNLTFAPSLHLGASGAITGHLAAHSYTLRRGVTTYDYDSQRTSDRLVTTREVTSESGPIDENGVTVDLDADGHAFITSGIAFKPEITLASLADVEFVTLFGGLQIDAELAGNVDAAFEVVAGESETSLEADARILLEATPTLQYRIRAAVSPHPRWAQVILGDAYVFMERDWELIYRGGTIPIFDFSIRILHDPEVLVDDSGGITCVGFDIAEEAAVREHVRYYYTLDGSEPEERAEDLWDGNPVCLDESAVVTVRGIVLNADYSSSYWDFGKSISQTVVQNVAAQTPVPGAPQSVSATDTNPIGIVVSWDASDYAVTYDVYGSDDAFGDYTLLASTANTSYTDLFANSRYYKVKACNEDGLCSDFSTPVYGKKGELDDPGPDIPLVTADAGEDQFVLNMTKEPVVLDGSGSSAQVGHLIISYRWSEDGTTLSNYKVHEQSFGLGVHEITLTVRTNTGHEDSDTVIITVKDAPTAPTNVRVEDTETTTPIITLHGKRILWDPVETATHYEVYYAAAENGPYTQHGGDINATVYEITNTLTLPSPLFFSVKACDRTIGVCSGLSAAAE